VTGSVLAILDQAYLPDFLRARRTGKQTEESLKFKTVTRVKIYDDRYPDFQSWMEARSKYIKVQIEASRFTDRHTFAIYDSGPFVEHMQTVTYEVTDENGNVIGTESYEEAMHQDGGNFGFGIDLGMPEFAEWSSIHAPMFEESDYEYAARVMTDQNAIADFAGDIGFVVMADDNGSMVSLNGVDLPRWTPEEIEAVRTGANAS
jgi:hypothetical protein